MKRNKRSIKVLKARAKKLKSEHILKLFLSSVISMNEARESLGMSPRIDLFGFHRHVYDKVYKYEKVK